MGDAGLRADRACQTGDFADRLDGKVAQVVQGDPDAPLSVVLSKDDSEL